MSNGLASYSSTSYAPAALIVPGTLPLNGKYSLASGTLNAGAVLGVVMDTPVAAAVAGNTGNGTIGTLSMLAGVKEGVYKIMCIEPASNGGVFEVSDPDGYTIGRAVVASAFANQIGFTIADGATDFVAGDSFTFTVTPLAGPVVKLSVAAATDGSGTPRLVLMHAADAALAAVECLAYERADVIESALSFGAGHTADTVRAALRARGIVLIPAGQ